MYKTCKEAFVELPDVKKDIEAVVDAGQGVIQKGKELADVAKTNSLISDAEKKISTIYEQIGRKYVELHKDSSEKELKDLINTLASSEKQLADLKDKLIEVKGVVKCPSCGAEVEMGSAFCPVCGEKMVSVKKLTNDTIYCDSCGAPIAEGKKFCTACGKKIS